MKNNHPIVDVVFSQLKVDDMLVPDWDCFMLGDRWVVETINEKEAFCRHWICGIRDKWECNCRIVKPNDKYWKRDGETLEEWKNPKNFFDGDLEKIEAIRKSYE